MLLPITSLTRTATLLLAIASGVVVAAISTPQAHGAFPGENGEIAFRCGGDICVTDAQGTVVTRLTESKHYDAMPAFSADGRRIAFSRRVSVSPDTHEIFVMRSDGTHVSRLTRSPPETFNYYPAFSPNGRRIVFQRQGGVYVMRANGTGATRLTSGGDPSFSPDGNRIVFVRSGGPPNDYLKIYLMDPDGSDVDLVTSPNDDVDSRHPSFAPSGQRIVFSRGGLVGPNGDGLFVVDSDGSDLTRVTSPGGDDDHREPAFSPTGKRIAFINVNTCDECGFPDRLHVMDADGTNPRPLLNAGPGADPDWGPKGDGQPADATCGDRQATIVGTPNPDVVTGTAGRDVIASRGDGDVIKGKAGNDVVCSGGGADILRGGQGDDRLFGGRGPDTLVGGKGRDRCRGGNGKDKFRSCER